MSHPFSDSMSPSPPISPPGQPATRSRSGCWVGLIFGFFLALFVVCGGGLGALAYFGLSTMTDEIETSLRDNSILEEHVGKVESIDLNLGDSMDTDEDIWVYTVRGSKSRGTLIVDHITGEDGDEEIRAATLRLPDGTEVDLLPAESAP